VKTKPLGYFSGPTARIICENPVLSTALRLLASLPQSTAGSFAEGGQSGGLVRTNGGNKSMPRYAAAAHGMSARARSSHALVRTVCSSFKPFFRIGCGNAPSSGIALG